jgi:hypothetical protein
MRSGSTWAIVLGIAAMVVGVGIYGIRLIQEGFSMRDKPSRVETFVAQKSWRWAIPAKARNLKN